MTAAICLLIVSFAYALWVFHVKQMRLASNYMVFILFSSIYSVFPVLTVLGIEPEMLFKRWPLNESVLLVSTHATVTAACIFVWAYSFHRSQRPGDEVDAVRHANTGAGAALVFLLYMLICVVLIAWGSRHSYASGSLSEMGQSGMAKAKVLLASIYILYVARYGADRRLLLMFLGFVGLLLVEHSRWFFVSVLFVSAFYLQNTGRLTNKQIIVLGLVFFLLLSFVGLYRLQIPLTSVGLILNPLYIEGNYGSYMVLQTYDLLFRGEMRFCTMFADYLVDPFLYLLPRPIFVLDNATKEMVGIFAHFVRVHQPFMEDKYAPVGGFNYIAQASSAFPFVGPILVTWLLASLTIKVENRRNRNDWWSLMYYLYSGGFLFVFLKTRFDITINYLLTLAVPALVLYFLISRYARPGSSMVGKKTNSQLFTRSPE